MKFIKKPQLISITLAVFLIVLLLLLPRVEVSDKKIPAVDAPASGSVENSVELAEADKSRLDNLLAKIASIDDPLEKIELYDSLSNFWESRGQVYRSAEALSEIADILQDKPSYFIAGDKYFEVFQQNAAEEEGRMAIEKAIFSYEKVLELNPDDLEAMTSLGVCYVEGAQFTGEAPMKGIGMLLKVLELDPNNINALINLGYFATKSGQYEKAEERFKKVLVVEPNYIEAYLYLSDLYIKTGDRAKAVEQLELYKGFITDPELIQQLEEYIEKVRNNN
ncbi:MAG: tetratricopeptide repeat protein [Vicingaceae bacterium]